MSRRRNPGKMATNLPYSFAMSAARDWGRSVGRICAVNGEPPPTTAKGTGLRAEMKGAFTEGVRLGYDAAMLKILQKRVDRK